MIDVKITDNNVITSLCLIIGRFTAILKLTTLQS